MSWVDWMPVVAGVTAGALAAVAPLPGRFQGGSRMASPVVRPKTMNAGPGDVLTDVCVGKAHGLTCELDVALTDAGLPDQASRDEVRAEIAKCACAGPHARTTTSNSVGCSQGKGPGISSENASGNPLTRTSEPSDAK